MRYLKTFESHKNNKILIIVDVQKSFSKFFTNNYVKAVKKYSEKFNSVYQIFDNHVDGKNPDKEYLYDDEPEVKDDHKDLYEFKNQKDVIEKRYRYNVNVDFFKKILNKDVFNKIKEKEDNKQLNRGEMFPTTEGNHIVYVGNNHAWFDIPKKLYNLFIELKGQEVVIIGGADNECIMDIITAAKSLGVNVIENKDYIYSAKNCPIK